MLGENDIEAVLLRLDRLTLDEARATGAQTLEVVHGLVRHRRAVLDGKNTTLSLSLVRYRRLIPVDLDDGASAGSVWRALGQFSCCRFG